VPGIGGRLKEQPEDFRVDEIPLYPFAGQGAHALFRVRKRSMTTHDAVSRLAQAVRLPDGQIGFAGIKDSRAVTTQWFSAPAKVAPTLQKLQLPGIEVLEITRHTNKLRSGHLAGNQFDILVRDAGVGAEESCHQALQILSRRGVPNFFGPQRFGTKQDSDQIGRALFREDFDEALRWFLGAPSPLERNPRIHEARICFESGRFSDCLDLLPTFLRTERRVLQEYLSKKNARSALRRIPKSLRLLFLSAYQARLFNRCLERRLEQLDVLHDGDVAVKHANGAAFLVADAAAEQLRTQAFEISPAGPLFGQGLLRCAGLPASREEDVFAAEDLDPEARSSPFKDVHLKGERRPYRFPLRDAEVLSEAEGLRIRFRLPRGCYATTALAEIMKN
jgi:tRNA pseudouridine13 synthase